MSATVRCRLCPKECRIPSGARGDCRIRVNLEGRLTAVTYGYPCAVHVDPMEKKPLFHFLPGTSILSIATAGCNLHCANCQNWTISQADPENVEAIYLPPAAIIDLARRHQCPSVAFTYTEPLIFYEYTFDAFDLLREAGLRAVLVTAGYLNRKPLRELYHRTDAANIDLKFMSDRLYREVCDATLAPVQEAIVLAREMGVWVEVTNLVIPTLNDDDAQLQALSRWVAREVGPDTPLHFSAFFPQYRMRHLPPTPASTLERAAAIARAEGLRYVYIGNVLSEKGQDTFCPKCGERLVVRRRFAVTANRIVNGACASCGERVGGVWN